MSDRSDALPCTHEPQCTSSTLNYAPSELEAAAFMCKALADPLRLHLLLCLAQGEMCVSELVERAEDKLSSVSARLKLLHNARLVTRRREAKHVFYALADRHVEDLIRNVLQHAVEVSAGASHPSTIHRSTHMTNCSETSHERHDHQHGPQCGHVAVLHEGHIDYLHDGHLHHAHGDHVDEHLIAVSATNPEACTPQHACAAHAVDHLHGPGCGHPAVPHGDHVDYLVDGHLHHPHGNHCDNHGPITLA